MSAGPLTVLEAVKQRLRIVQEISSAQSRHLLNLQIAGGTEFEVQQIEREIAATGASHALTAALNDARARLQKADAAMAVCAADCAALESQLEKLDRRIADGG